MTPSGSQVACREADLREGSAPDIGHGLCGIAQQEGCLLPSVVHHVEQGDQPRDLAPPEALVLQAA
jgi:hypothetical protein